MKESMVRMPLAIGALSMVVALGVVAQADDSAASGRSEVVVEDSRQQASILMEGPTAAGGGVLDVVFDLAADGSTRGGQVNVSGATLFLNFSERPPSRQDWINMDCDFDCLTSDADCIGGEIQGGREFNDFTMSIENQWDPCEQDLVNTACINDNDCPDGAICNGSFCAGCAYRGRNSDRLLTCGQTQLDTIATDLISGGDPLNTFLLVNYRAVGSTNGIQEFVNHQVSFLNSLENNANAANPDSTCPSVFPAGCSAECQDVPNQIMNDNDNGCGATGPCRDANGRCDLTCVCNYNDTDDGDTFAHTPGGDSSNSIDPAICDLDIVSGASGTANRIAIADAVAEAYGCAIEECRFGPVFVPLSQPSDFSNLNGTQYFDGDLSTCIQSGTGYSPDAGCPDTCMFECMESVDIGSTDVPVRWAIRVDDDDNENTGNTDANWEANPGADGYGANPIFSWDTNFSNQLKDLFYDANGDGVIQENERLNTNQGAPDCRTVFDTQVAHSIVAIISNRGTGVEETTYTDLQYHFTTGRRKNGENLVAATRDSGSGTRNIAMNGLCIDPSWGRGENRGDKNSSSSAVILGPDRQNSNCGGSSVMESVVQNHRLAIGYTGIAGSSRSSRDIARGFYEGLGVANDFVEDGGVTTPSFRRPTIDNILDNGDAQTSYRIAGEQTFATRGNAFSNLLSTNEFYVPGPAVFNARAADWLNNIVLSQAQFIDEGQTDENIQLAGEFLAERFFTPAGVDKLPLVADGCDYADTASVLGAFNQPLQDFMRANLDLGNSGETDDAGIPYTGDFPEYGRDNDAGMVPRRKAIGPDQYSDGNIDNTYCYFDGMSAQTIIGNGSNRLSKANRTAGDFDIDFDRDQDDIDGLVEATLTPRTWQMSGAGDCANSLTCNADATGPDAAGPDNESMNADQAIPEVIGDFNGDGNLDKEDWRYAMDGLYLVGGQLDRKTTAISIDNAIVGINANLLPWNLAPSDTWPPLAVTACVDNVSDPSLVTPPATGVNDGGSPFLVTGATYEAGDFRADVAGGSFTAPGAEPVGADGEVNLVDVEYVRSNVRPTGANWGDDIVVAQRMDLSADMTGDASVTSADICEIVEVILEADLGDLDLNGATCDDFNSLNMAASEPTYTDGDLNGDNAVDGCDEKILLRRIALETANVNGDSMVDIQDADCVLDFAIGNTPAVSCTGDGDVFPPCGGGDSSSNLFDVLFILDSIEEFPDVTCPDPCDGVTLPATAASVAVVELDPTSKTTIQIVPNTRSVAPGDMLTVEVFVQDAAQLQGAQVSLDVTGRAGSLVLESIEINGDRADFALAGDETHFSAKNTRRALAMSLLRTGATSVRRGYVATFVYSVPENAKGTYRIAADMGETKLLDAEGAVMPLRKAQSASVIVSDSADALSSR